MAHIALAACGSSPVGPAQSPARVGDIQHVALALGEVSSGGAPREQPLPIYPPELLQQRWPKRDVHAHLTVDEHGTVVDVRIVDEGDAKPGAKQFDAAVADAAWRWTFDPLRIDPWAADANGNVHDVGSETRAFERDYVFSFEWGGGRPVVRVRDATHAMP